MHSCSPGAGASTSTAPGSATAPIATPVSAPFSVPSSVPFSETLGLTEVGSGEYRAQLPEQWTVGGGRLHGGWLLALVTKAGLSGLHAHTRAEELADPLAVSAEYLRAPVTGPAELATEVVKVGRTVSVVRVVLRQRDQPLLTATVTAGQLPDAAADWADLPTLAPEPPADAVPTTEVRGPVPPLATACEVRLDPATAQYLRDESGEPMIRGWVRPRGEPADTLFALVAGDVLPPVLFNLGRPGWAPTVQLTALLRARPEPGWLRLEAASKLSGGGWFDEDCAVIDSAGRLICQARQLALAPLAR
jgi:uncharacterized protein (TIGR00369 family)